MGADENNRFVLDGKSGTPSFRPHPSFILIRNMMETMRCSREEGIGLKEWKFWKFEQSGIICWSGKEGFSSSFLNLPE